MFPKNKQFLDSGQNLDLNLTLPHIKVAYLNKVVVRGFTMARVVGVLGLVVYGFFRGT